MSETDEGLPSSNGEEEGVYIPPVYTYALAHDLLGMAITGCSISELEISKPEEPAGGIKDVVNDLVQKGYMTRTGSWLCITQKGIDYYYGSTKRPLPEPAPPDIKPSPKLRFDLISVEAMEGIAAGLTYGAVKHGDRDWQESEVEWSKVYRACFGHLIAHWRGEEIDAESGLPHIDLAACNMMFLQHFFKTNTGVDNRPKPKEK